MRPVILPLLVSICSLLLGAGQAAAATGILEVETNASGAMVYIDGQMVGGESGVERASETPACPPECTSFGSVSQQVRSQK